jgi:hypothetical protein
MVEDVYSGDDDQRRVNRCDIVHLPTHANDQMEIVVQFGHFPQTMAEFLLRKLRQLTCVIETHVLIHAADGGDAA